MLKSTHRPAAPALALPAGWSEHKAPSGHPYYYNAGTQQSTYTRPTQPQVLVPQQVETLLYNPPGSTISYLDHSNGYLPNANQHGSSHGHGDSGRNHYNRQRAQPMDRPKRKHEIPGCSPWLLVETKLGRRFVFNPENNESYWKFPLEVMKGVIEFDRLQREKKQQLQDARSQQDEEKHAHEKENEKAVAAADRATPDALAVPAPTVQDRVVADDDDEYEEVEVTDNEDEEEENAVKRQRIEDTNDQPVEFNEDDMAYQLAAMGEEYGLDPGEYGEGGEDLEEGAEGLELTEQDSSALFKDMLNDYNISPYSTWEKIVEAGQIVQDDRYTALPNMKSRKELWGQWSRERIQQLKEQREKEEKKDPRIPFFAFLQKYATPKLYWPEFRRKYKKEAEMRDSKISDKDREKWYREHINRLKLPESTLKSDLAALLKFVPLQVLNRSSSLDALPPSIVTDIRYISLKPTIRDPIIESHIAALSPAPTGVNVSPGESEELTKQRRERERREKALADRQAQVEDEKRRQKGVLQYSKGMLREGEQELERARKVGKEGLMGYMQDGKPPPLPEAVGVLPQAS